MPPVTGDPFVHLHVASGYSLRYGASHPHVLVERAAEHGMDTLALTDRDGVYGAVKFAQACRVGGHPADPRRRPRGRAHRAAVRRRRWCARRCGSAAARRAAGSSPARGGATVDPRHPRVTVLARRQAPAGRRCAGWSRPPTCAASAGSRSAPSTWSPSTSGPRPSGRRPAGAARSRLRGGPGADRPPSRPGPGGARPLARRSSAATDLLLEVVSPPRPGRPAPRAARMLGFAAEERRAGGAHQRGPLRRPRRRARPPTCSTPPAGWSRSTPGTSTGSTPRATSSPARRWRAVADEVAAAAGLGERAARRLLAATRRVADRCARRPAGRPRHRRGAPPRARRARPTAPSEDPAPVRTVLRRALRGRARPPRRWPPTADGRGSGSTTSSG